MSRNELELLAHLGLLLSILYTNDDENSLSRFYLKMDADDTNISASCDNLLQLLEDLRRELEGIVDWLRQNKPKRSKKRVHFN